MAKPSPEFYSLPQGLEVAFFDLSINIPTSWLWNFGDSNTSTSQNPTHTYAAAGVYSVRLTATNADGSQDIIKIVTVSEVPTELGLTIEDMVKVNLPGALTLKPTIIPTLRKKWQMIMYPNIEGLDTSDIYNETAWPDNYNMLISYCILYDIFIILFGEGALAAIKLAPSGTSTTENINLSSDGVKRLVEGPAETEWFDTSQHLSNMFRAFGYGKSPFDWIISSGCSLAKSMGVKVPFCSANKLPVAPSVTTHIFPTNDPTCE